MAYLLGSPGAFAQTGTAPFISWMQGLSQNGYTVNQGIASEFAFDDCKRIYAPTFGTCFGNNPVTPYILANPPRSPSSNHLPSYMTAFDQPNHAPTSNTFYQLDTNEAIVTIIALPPQAAYYSFQSYMFSRPINSYHLSPAQGPCPGPYTPGSKMSTTPDCLDFQVSGFFDNAINDVVIKQQCGLQFSSNGSQAIAVITTANSTLYNNLVSGFTTGHPMNNSNEIFFEHMPTKAPDAMTPPLLNIGVSDQTKDIFASIIRYASPNGGIDPSQPGGMWLANAASNVLVYRVQMPSLAPTQLPNNTITSQSCNNNETATAGADPNCPTTSAYFDSDLKHLLQIITQNVQPSVTQYTYSSAQFSADYFQTSGHMPQGPNCITHGNRCLGATADNDSYRGYNFGMLYSNAPTFVVGVNHSAGTEVTTTTPVNNATYTSISAADGAYNAGATDISQIDAAAAGFMQTGPTTLSGSAAAVLATFGLVGSNPTQYPHLNADLPNLYIAVFERTPSNCTSGSYCDPQQSFVTVVDQVQKKPGAGYIPSNDTVLLTERGYLLPSVNASQAPMPTAYFSGAAAAYLESPYVLYAQPNSMTATPEMLKGLHH